MRAINAVRNHDLVTQGSRALAGKVFSYLVSIFWTSKVAHWSTHYNMTVQILAGNGIDFSIAVGLIRLHMPNVKKLRCQEIACNEGEHVSPYSPCQSPSPFIGNSSNHWCQKQHCNLQLCLWINRKYVLFWKNFFLRFQTRQYQRCEVERHEHRVPCKWALWGDNSHC